MIKILIIGFASGIVCGLFSAGGGLILLPACIYILKLDEKQARATTIFSILPMVITSAIFYNNSNSIDYSVGIRTAIGGIVGGFIGSKLLKKVNNQYLKIVFIVFLVYAAINLLVIRGS